MSSTNVRSKNNIEIIIGDFQVNQRDNKIDMPPSSAKRWSVSIGEENTISIEAFDSKLNDKGILVGNDKQVVAQFDKKEISKIVKRRSKKQEKEDKKEEVLRD